MKKNRDCKPRSLALPQRRAEKLPGSKRRTRGLTGGAAVSEAYLPPGATRKASVVACRSDILIVTNPTKAFQLLSTDGACPSPGRTSRRKDELPRAGKQSTYFSS